MGFYTGEKVLVTGGNSFLAAHIVPALLEAGAEVAVTTRGGQRVRGLQTPIEVIDVDLRDRNRVIRAMQGQRYVVHLAAVGWGFHENFNKQPSLLSENVLLTTNVIDAAFQAGVERLSLSSSSAVYPKGTDILEEDAPWDADPHPGEAGFGWAKRVGEIQARMYHERYGMGVSIVRPTNPYGPWDNIHPDKSHVLPALIRRALSGETPFIVWGTGRPIRSFVHVSDLARIFLAALEHRADARPINGCSPESVSVADLVRVVLKAAGREDAPIQFDTSKPDGPPRKLASAKRIQEELGITDFIPLATGVAETIAWFRTLPEVS